MPTLSEYESKQLLARAGIPVPEERLVATPEEAVSAAHEVGMPVVLKLCGAGIAHKTERNLVRLDLADEASIRKQAKDLLSQRQADEQDAGILVQPMVSGRREVIAGLVRDPQFGPCVMFGLGGVLAEVLQDVAFAVAPLDDLDAQELIESLQHSELLGNFRGEPAVDRARLGAILRTLGEIGVERPELRAIDVNPLILRGSEPIVVDALVEVEGPAPGDKG